MRGVDAGFAADRRVDLGKQGRRDLHEADTAAKNARGKACKVADHAAAKGYNDVAALDAKFEQTLAHIGDHGEALAMLARGNHDLAEKELSEALLQPIEIERGNGFVADHGAARTCQRRGDPLAGAIEQMLADDDVIVAVSERHADRGLAGLGRQFCQFLSHHSPLPRTFPPAAFASRSSQRMSASTVSATINSWGTSRLSTVMSASA